MACGTFSAQVTARREGQGKANERTKERGEEQDDG